MRSYDYRLGNLERDMHILTLEENRGWVRGELARLVAQIKALETANQILEKKLDTLLAQNSELLSLLRDKHTGKAGE